MNKIELANALLHETGNESYDIDSVNSANPDHQKYITWIDRAYNSLQTKPVRWRWMIQHAECNLLPPKQKYSPVELGITNVKDYLYNSFGVFFNGSEYPIYYIGQTEYNQHYRGSTATSNLPNIVYIDNEQNLIFYPKFTEQCKVRFDFFQWHKMTEDTHAPRMPESYHELVLFLASKYAAIRDNNPELYQDSVDNYRMMYKEMYKRESLIL